MGYIKHDIELFDYDKRYHLPSEHTWDFMVDEEKEKEYFEERAKICFPIIGNVQSNPEKTGQIGTMI